MLHNNNITCEGKIKTIHGNCLKVQHLLEEENEQKESEVEITSSDIYKDLRINGYDFGPKFQNLLTIKTNDFNEFRGELEWTGSVLTFIEGMLHTYYLTEPIRQMKVPVQIRSLRCDPQIFYQGLEKRREHTLLTNSSQLKISEQTEEEELIDLISANIDSTQIIENYRIFESKLPFYLNCAQNVLVTPGVEIEKLFTRPITRKSDEHLAQLDSYEFVANNETNTIEECDKCFLLEYVQVSFCLQLMFIDEEIILMNFEF